MDSPAFDPTDPVTLGEFIRAQRIAADLSQAEAARRAGVSRRTWCEVETGQRKRSTAQTLNQFDQVLGLAEGTLYAMTQRSRDQRAESLRQRAIHLIRRMSTDELRDFVEGDPLRDQVAALRAAVEALGNPHDAPDSAESGRRRRPGRDGDHTR